MLSFVQQVVGPTRELTPDATRLHRWDHAATFRGRELCLSLTGRVRTAQSLSLGVSLEQRPVQLSIQLRSVDVMGTALLPGALPGYPAELATRGSPRAVLEQVVLDPQAMGALTRRTGRTPLLFTENGWLFIQVEPVTEGALPSPTEIATWLEALVELADRIVAAFDRTHAQLSAERGPAAAAAWLEEQRNALTRRASSTEIVRVVAIAVAALVTALITLTIPFSVAC